MSVWARGEEEDRDWSVCVSCFLLLGLPKVDDPCRPYCTFRKIVEYSTKKKNSAFKKMFLWSFSLFVFVIFMHPVKLSSS